MRRSGSSAGFTLLEVLVSMSMFSVAALALAEAFSVQLAFNNSSETRSSAIMAAQQVLDQQRVLDPTTLPANGASAPASVTIGNRTFQVTLYYCENASYCSSSTVRQIRAEVNYHGKVVYDVETIYAQLR